jgi:uncharacterized protein (DUF433 family)
MALTHARLPAMLSSMSELMARITIDPSRMHGRPCIRDLRITVADVLGLLAAGQSQETILEEYPYLEGADIDAALAFAVRQADHPIVAAE